MPLSSAHSTRAFAGSHPTQWTQLGKSLCLHQSGALSLLPHQGAETAFITTACESSRGSGAQAGGTAQWYNTCVVRERPWAVPSTANRRGWLMLLSCETGRDSHPVSHGPHLDDQLQIVHVPLLCLNQLVNVALPLPLHGLHCVQGLEIGAPCRDKAELNDTTSVPQGRWDFSEEALLSQSITRLRRAGMSTTLLLEVNLPHLLSYSMLLILEQQ